jgi:hypothetical protein
VLAAERQMDSETLYRQLGRLLETMPDFNTGGGLTSEQMQWLARGRALIAEVDVGTVVEFDTASDMISQGYVSKYLPRAIFAIHKALARAELDAPAAARGAFIPAKNSFDAFAAINKILQSAKKDVFIVDPYLDEAVLTEFGGSIPSAVTLRLLSDQSSVKASLKLAATSWVAQHKADQPLQVRLAKPKELHDRLIIVDGTVAYTLTQSLKDFAKRAPAEIVRADDTAELKISAYEEIWTAAQVVV